jgi:hypothetical protein
MALRRERLRAKVMAAAADASVPGTAQTLISARADQMWAWITRPEPAAWQATLTITDSVGHVTHSHTLTGAVVADTATMPVDQFGAVTLNEVDSKGNPLPATAGQLTWTADDNGSLLTLRVSDDTHTVAFDPVGPEGTVHLTGADPAEPQLASYVLALDLGPGSPAALAGAFRTSATPIDPNAPAT